MPPVSLTGAGDPIVAVVVETSELLQTVAASAIAGVGITVVFSIAIWGAARSAELGRSERPVAASAAAVLGFVALGVTLAAVAVGLLVMTGK